MVQLPLTCFIARSRARTRTHAQSGRMDLACRAVSAAMFFSSGVRRDVDVVLLLGEEEVLKEKDTAGAVAITECEELGKTGKEGKDFKTFV